jgi:NhaP-type Na+/H+ or K+/H+ antiporter
MSNVTKILAQQLKGLAFITIGVMLLLEKFGLLTVGFDVYLVVFLAIYFIAIGFSKLNKASRLNHSDKLDL